MLPIYWEMLAIHENLQRCVQGGVLGPWIGLKWEDLLEIKYLAVFDNILMIPDLLREVFLSISRFFLKGVEKELGNFLQWRGSSADKVQGLISTTFWPVFALYYDVSCCTVTFCPKAVYVF